VAFPRAATPKASPAPMLDAGAGVVLSEQDAISVEHAITTHAVTGGAAALRRPGSCGLHCREWFIDRHELHAQRGDVTHGGDMPVEEESGPRVTRAAG
jgi:hypothetical protein